MKHNPIGRILRIGVAAVAASLLGLGALAAPAMASDIGNIDTQEPRSLTIHKYEQPSGDPLGPNDGTEITPPVGSNPLEGVVFSVRKVTDIDLMTQAGWTAAQTLTVPQAQAGNLDGNIGGATLADGSLTLSSLPIGLYLVEETSPGDNNIVAPAQPFLVAVPQPMGDGEWNYNVHVYPKNALQGAPTKGVNDDAAYKIGDNISWPLTIPVANLPEGSEYETYVISDVLQPELGFQSISIQLGATPLVSGTHYTPSTPVVNTNGTVTLTFTPAGLDALNEAGASTITGTIVTNVLSIGTGTITNQFSVNVNGKPTSSNIPESYWGALKIVKHAEGNEAAVLAGVKFDLYVNTGTMAAPVRGALVLSDLTTDANGVILVEGLNEGLYVLDETAAPAGYQELTADVPVNVVRGTVESPNLYKVANVQKPPFELPITGGVGTLIFTFVGVGLLLVAAGAFFMMRKRRAITQVSDE